VRSWQPHGRGATFHGAAASIRDALPTVYYGMTAMTQTEGLSDPSDARTMELLDRWVAGDGDALVELVGLHVPWLRRHISRQMSARLRLIDTSEDVVQSVLLNLLRSGPKFRPANAAQFRGLVLRAAKNRLCELHEFVGRDKRNPDRAQPLPSRPSQADICIPSVADPGRKVSAQEERALVMLALSLIEPDDRRLIEWFDFDCVPYATIGERLSISEEGARSRHRRALARLKQQADRLREGQLDDMLRDLRDERHGDGADGADADDAPTGA
jgi:RNA polymerase sigma factor (sigma-70 family)